MQSWAQQYLGALFTPEVQRLDDLLGTDFCQRWGYPKGKGRANSLTRLEQFQVKRKIIETKSQ